MCGFVCLCVGVRDWQLEKLIFFSLPCLTTHGSSRPGMEPMHPVHKTLRVHKTLKHRVLTTGPPASGLENEVS